MRLPRLLALLPPSSAWFWRVPQLAVLLFVLVIAGFVWLTLRSDLEEQRATLISDVLWLEQDLRFQMERNETVLQTVGEDLLQPRDRELAFARMQQVLQQESGLVAIAWLDDEGVPLGAMPPDRVAAPVERIEAIRRARAFGRRSYSAPYRQADGEASMELVIPLFERTTLRGFVVGRYAFSALLARQVPWWFSERYRVSVIEGGVHLLASKSRVEAGEGGLSYEFALDPPGAGLSLRVQSYRTRTSLIPLLLIGTLLAFAATIVWTLWMLRRHIQRLHRTEAALREEHAFRVAMENSTLTGLRARDLEGRVTWVNPAFCRIVGWPADELVGRAAPMPYWLPDDYERTTALHKEVMSGRAPPGGFEMRFRRRNGELFDALIYEAPLIDSSGRHTGWMGSVLDVTERKRTEEIARQQQERLQATSRLITMGEMASTLAHELNQPLSAISSYSTGCLNALEGGELPHTELLTVLHKISKQAQRAGSIIRRIYDFVRRSEPKREAVDLNRVVLEAVGLVEPEARQRGLRIQTRLAVALAQPQADPVMVEQVAINLLRNAMDAVRDQPALERLVRIASSAHEAGVCMSVEDSGPGVPPDIAEKLFAPFFSTKPDGMGMGLNICRSIAELHKGRLWFEAREGGGTVFHFLLPTTPEHHP